MLRRLAVAGTLLASLMAPGGAMAFDDPEALVTAIYEPYTRGEFLANPERYFSAELIALLGQYETATASEDVVGLDFDPFINGQDALLYRLTIGEPIILGDRALVQVSFYNFDHPSLISLSLVRERGEWLVDDIASLGTDEHWLFSWVLRFDPWAY
jgi:hypothetical protein